MKFSFLLLLGMILSFEGSATFLTVSNTPTVPAQYETLAAAIADASDNDTIYINASPSTYDGATINKKVAIIGAGHTDLFGRGVTRISQCNFTSAASGTTLEGLRFTENPFFFVNGITLTDIRISRCLFSSTRFLDQSSGAQKNFINWVIHNCIIDVEQFLDEAQYHFYNNFIVSNCIFLDLGSFANQTPGVSSSDAIFFRNNLFFGDTEASMFGLSGGVSFENNIFLNEPENPCADCDFLYNVFATCSACDGLGDTNMVGEAPQFVNLPDGTEITESLDEINLNLTPVSVGYQGGQDGTDVGVFGGGFPMNLESAYGSIPKVPYVYSFLLANPVVGEGNDLDYTIEVQSAQ